ncbi:hypothetical protein EVA_00578, partial [gut metagenome]
KNVCFSLKMCTFAAVFDKDIN